MHTEPPAGAPSDAAKRAAPETLRMHLANERTLLAWIRTGLAMMAFGFAIARFGLFLREIAQAGRMTLQTPEGFGSAWLGAALVALGFVTNAVATLRYDRVRRRVERGDVGAPSSALLYGVGALLAMVGLAMTILLGRTLIG